MRGLLLIAGLAAAHTFYSWMAAGIRGRRAADHKPPQYPPRMDTRITILVPAWNERKVLERCLAAVGRLEHPNWECVVIAGGDDGTFDQARNLCAADSRFKVIRQGPLGKNAALNMGLAHAQGETIALLDADSVVEKEWLSALVSPIAAGLDAATGNFLPLRETAISRYFLMEKIDTYCVRNQAILYGGGSIALKRTCIEEIGGFPEDVRVGVDWDLNARFELLGKTKVFVPDAKLLTELPATLPEFARNEIRWRRAHIHSLFRLKRRFLSNPWAAFLDLYYYFISLLFVTLPIAALAVFLVIGAQMAFFLLALWGVFIAWLTARRAALALEVAAYSGEWQWLRLAHLPPSILLLSFICSIMAVCSLHGSTQHFKGPRPAPEAKHEAR